MINIYYNLIENNNRVSINKMAFYICVVLYL
uniref:Uncharacterized protein n=1 Tax=viral metagenome TaxID=1070528 RepID=A0A6C0H956_9ZZZZ